VSLLSPHLAIAPLVKFIATGSVACLTCYLFAGLLLGVPGISRVVLGTNISKPGRVVVTVRPKEGGGTGIAMSLEVFNFLLRNGLITSEGNHPFVGSPSHPGNDRAK
jgi:hypothetical protein